MRLRPERSRALERTSGRISVAVIASEAKQSPPRGREIASARYARLAMTLEISHGHVRLALAHFCGVERLPGGTFGLGDGERRRAHALRLLREAGRAVALAHRLRSLAQAQPRHDDRVVGRDQVLLRTVLDRTHALLHRGVLHGEALDAVVGAVLLLR